MGNNQRLGQLRKKAPQLIAAAIIIIVVAYFVIDFLDDVVMEGAPVTSEPIISLILAITYGVTSTVKAWGYFGIFGLMLLESSSLPIPSEVILPFAGYLSSTGQLQIWIILVISTAAGIIGSLIDYYIGLVGVNELIKHKILGKVILSTAQLEVAEKWFNKHGNFMVFVSRIIPGFRTTFSFPAGAAKMKLSKFVAYTTAGCLLWNSVLVGLGWYLGKNWTEVAGFSRYFLIIAVISVAAVIAYYLYRRYKKVQRQKESVTKKETAKV